MVGIPHVEGPGGGLLLSTAAASGAQRLMRQEEERTPGGKGVESLPWQPSVGSRLQTTELPRTSRSSRATNQKVYSGWPIQTGRNTAGGGQRGGGGEGERADRLLLSLAATTNSKGSSNHCGSQPHPAAVKARKKQNKQAFSSQAEGCWFET